MATKSKRLSIRTLIGLLLITAALLMLLGYLSITHSKSWIMWLSVIPVEIFLAYILLQSLGSCPLKWRKLSVWAFVILFAHMYWINFLLAWFFTHPYHFDWLAQAIATVAITIGLRLRLQQAYQRCNCQLSAGLVARIDQDDLLPYTDHHQIQAFISHHPAMPAIISKSFGWKTMAIGKAGKWKLNLICTGKSLVSLPHMSYGALYAANHDQAVIDDMKKHIEQMHFRQGFEGIEFRGLAKENKDQAFKVTSYLSLQQDEQSQWRFFSSNLRRKINKAQRHGYSVQMGGQELLNDFYAVYARHMRSLGSGALRRTFFENLLNGYNTGGGAAVIFLIYQGSHLAGGAFNLSYKGFYENGWFATHKKDQQRYASYLLHHEMIRHAIGTGCKVYSFGRSTSNGGVHRFKQQWGTSDLPLHWLSYPQPAINLRSQSWIRTLWKRLPYPLGNRFGNYIAKWVY